MKIANVVLNDFRNDNRVLKVSRSLAASGHDIEVVALHHPDFPVQMKLDGFEVYRVPLATEGLPKGKFFQLIKYLELIVKISRKYRRYHAWHCNDTEAFVIGLFAKLMRPRLKLVYDCHEYESERNARSKLENGLVGLIEKCFIRYASKVITVSPSIRRDYERKYNLKDVALVRNIPNARTHSSKTNILRENFGIPKADTIFLYQGALTYNRGVETILQSFHQLDHEPVHLIFMGYGPLQGMVEESAKKHNHIHFQPAVPYDELLKYTGSADVGLISVRPVCLSYLYCLPNKLFEYIQAGLPVLSNALPDCESIIKTYHLGDIVKPDEPEFWSEKVLQMHKEGTDQYEDGLKRAAMDLQWEKEEQILIDIYSSLQE